MESFKNLSINFDFSILFWVFESFASIKFEDIKFINPDIQLVPSLKNPLNEDLNLLIHL